tara:strand:+ start:52 stop:675 length:624 start_codon:yes stop_codon:yes gene_type:complete
MEKEKIINTDNENKDATEGEIKSDNDLDNEKDEVVSSEDKIKNLEDKLSRTLAEMENQRRRFEKERDDAFEYGGFSFAKEALNVIDNLERSKISLENDEDLKKNNEFKKISEHLEIVYNDTISIFKKNNIEQIDCINKKLDPNFHQAMLEVEDDSKEPGTIVQEIQKGFLMKDRLLRPSLVGVSKKSKKEDNKDNKTKENEHKNDEK